MEPIVCTLLRLWMLPLLQRAYINLAGSKQRCGARALSPHSKLFLAPASAMKDPLVSVLGSPRAQPEMVLPWLIYQQPLYENRLSSPPPPPPPLHYFNSCFLQSCCSFGFWFRSNIQPEAVIPKAQEPR